MAEPSLTDTLLETAIAEKASDLHISVGHPPTLRISGRLVPLAKHSVMNERSTKEFASSLLKKDQQERLEKEREIDFSYNFQNKARFRVNIFHQKEAISCALRLIPTTIQTIEELNLPQTLNRFTQAHQGLVLITGPSGHGKSTTLAAIIDQINQTRAVHIITIEDPIEYVFEDNMAIVDQREVYQDTLSFSKALRATFRQDPDVIMVGEMRDAETIATAITAAETGHLVFATLHTNSAAQTIHRVVDSFPAEQQDQIRSQVSSSLLGVVSQRLIPRLKGGLIPALELLMATPAVGSLIRDGKVHELPLVIETSAELGMISLNRSLANLVRAREISLERALVYSQNPGELRSLTT